VSRRLIVLLAGLTVTSAAGTIDNYDSMVAEQVAPGLTAAAARAEATNPVPADGEQGVVLPLLQWTAGATAFFHNVYLGTSPRLGETDLVGLRSPVPLCYRIQGLAPDTTYYWRVDEVEADLVTVHTGEVWSFRTAPATAFDPVPADGARWVSANTALSWKAGKDAIGHGVYFGTDKTAVESGAAGTFQKTIYLTTWQPPALAPATTYYWRIDEVAADGSRKAGQLWSFTVLEAIGVSDPNLLAWWKMDEGAGAAVVDWSGHGRHAGFGSPAPAWATGLFGGALRFAGNGDSAVCADGSFLNGLAALTVTAWIRSDATHTDRGLLIFETPTGADNMDLRYDAAGRTGGGRNGMKIGVTVSVNGSHTILQLESSGGRQTTDWQHLALVWSSGQALKLYINGRLDTPTANSAAATGPLANSSAAIIGKGGKDTGDCSWAGLIDEVRVYDKALTLGEVETVMRSDARLAWSPSPANGAITDIARVVPLTWRAGEEAAQHDVYLGVDPIGVGAASDSDATGLYRGRQTGTSFTPAVPLDVGRKYFWRIDEVDGEGCARPGIVWSFTLADYLIVDDFEDYTEDEGARIYESWIDGWSNDTGSTVGYVQAPFAEQEIVHSGRQSLPLDFNNVQAPFYSEAQRQFSPVQDWTAHGMTDLVLYVRGYPVSFLESAPGAIAMSAAGTDIWNTADQGRYAWRRLAGNGAIVARVESLDNTDPWAKAGVMIRENLAPGARFAAVYLTPGHGVRFQARAMSDRAATSDSAIATPVQEALAGPIWVRIERTGDDFNAFYSADGKAWTAMSWNPQTIDMAASVYVGLVLTSHNAAALCTAQFTDIAATGGISGHWQTTDLGIAQPGNSREDLYVAIRDSADKIAVVTHPDPAAVNAPSWTEWKIPLDSFAGVNLAEVRKMYIGIGDRQDPAAGGRGRLFIDDLRLTKSKP
jgi:regulation of enolase protein 1 (concanavalin A-like superfamily)